MKKLTACLIAAALCSCASSKLETPDGTYRWKRGGLTWKPGKWVLVEPMTIIDDGIIAEPPQESK